jgi:hypothetical protein
MFLSSKNRSLNVPIPPTGSGVPLVKSPSSYTSPDTSKSILLGNGAAAGKEKLSDVDYSHMDPDDMFVRYSVAEMRVIRARLLWVLLLRLEPQHFDHINLAEQMQMVNGKSLGRWLGAFSSSII